MWVLFSRGGKEEDKSAKNAKITPRENVLVYSIPFDTYEIIRISTIWQVGSDEHPWYPLYPGVGNFLVITYAHLSQVDRVAQSQYKKVWTLRAYRRDWWENDVFRYIPRRWGLTEHFFIFDLTPTQEDQSFWMLILSNSNDYILHRNHTRCMDHNARKLKTL